MHSTGRKTPTPSSALSHQAHFQTISNGKSAGVFKYSGTCRRPHKYLTIHTKGSSVTAHAEFIFERNVGLLHDSYNVLQLILGWVCVTPRDPACPFITKHVLHIHTTYQIDFLGKGGTGPAKQKWFETLKSPITVYEKRTL